MHAIDSSNVSRESLELSVVIPVHNEGDLIEGILRDWSTALSEAGINFEIIIINDGSMDGTGRTLDKLRREMSQLRVIHQLNCGHGRAIRRGYELARGRYILQMDGNGCYETIDFARLWEERGPGKLVLAHRTHRLDRLPRRALSQVLRRFAEFLFSVELNDPNAPFRLIHRDSLAPLLKQLPQGWEATNYCMSLLMKRELPGSVVEIKVPYRKRQRGQMQTSFVDFLFLGWHVAGELVRFRRLSREGCLPPQSELASST
jgi:dolichol-phosphate mannosyltransferase